MPVPKIRRTTHTTTLPLSGMEVRYRAYTVKEEKILMQVKDSDDVPTYFNAISTVLANCIVEPEDADPENLTHVDLEWIFLHIRAASVDNIIEIRFKDKKDGKIRTIEVDINEIEPKFDETHGMQFEVGDGNYLVTMRYPTMGILRTLGIKSIDDMESQEASDAALGLVGSCIESILDKESDTVYDEFSFEEVTAMLDDFSHKDMDRIRNFFETMPSIEHTVSYVNDEGDEIDIVLRGMRDFFY